MTADRAIVIRCDGQPEEGHRCHNEGRGALPWHTTVAKIRRWLKAQGWHRLRDGRDICPDCWSESAHTPNPTPGATWCLTCHERKPCMCFDPMPLPYEDDGDLIDDCVIDDWATEAATR